MRDLLTGVYEFSVVVMEDEGRGYIAVVPELPGFILRAMAWAK